MVPCRAGPAGAAARRSRELTARRKQIIYPPPFNRFCLTRTENKLERRVAGS